MARMYIYLCCRELRIARRVMTATARSDHPGRECQAIEGISEPFRLEKSNHSRPS
jgi:hypothetical protein